MELHEFVKITLEQIVLGVSSAQTAIADTGARVNPKDLSRLGPGDGILFDPKTGRPVQEVAFDIAVTISQGREAHAGAGIFVGVFGFGAQGKKEGRRSHVDRIQFSVPLSLPIQDE